MHGVILDDYLATQNGGYVFLFPKNGEPPESIDFRQYYKFRCYAMVGCGDRLFLSFDGASSPGTVLEYNVKTKKTELLVSTLDRSVKWPLQGRQTPYAISHLLCDPPRQRLIMLMHDKQSKQGYRSYTSYTIRFQAYCWETKTWQALSRLLPLDSTHDFNSFYLENGELWLLTEDGLGKINAEGNWQPVLILDGRRYVDDKLPNYRNGFEAVTIDYSQCGAFAKKYKDFPMPDAHFNHYDQGILFGRNWLIFVPEKTILPIVPSFRVMCVTQGGYAIGRQRHDYENLQIGVLKDRKELLKMGK